MAGFNSNIINLITDNLRDRYHNGFPVIKELVQNADDAKASRFVFGVHSGFPDCKHPLLQGSGLWCFNNGHFKETDKRAIRSFAENTKAGENSTIGKFGLGMKSVFHLCEAFFYIAYDGTKNYSEFLNPWDDKEPEHPHMDWDQVWNEQQNDDISYIQQAFADYLDADKSWFLLWIPLRCKVHLQADDGEEYGSIINSFPGDDPEGLNFLKEEGLAEKLGGLLPLLANLQEIRFVSLGSTQEVWKPYEFCVGLQAEPRMNLIDHTDVISSAGKIIKVTAQGEQVVPVWGRRIRHTQVGSPFDQLKKNERWPKTRCRDEKGKEKIASDKSSAESAILISHQEGTSGRLTLQWAVFLPLEEESHIVSIPIEGGSRHYRIVLHGQFFIDAGRRGIHDFKNLQHKLAAAEHDIEDEQALRSVWNRALAQQICLPLVLPALEEYVSAYQLKDNEVGKLTTALKEATARFDYMKFVTAEHSWFRELLPSGSRWRLHKNNDAVRILPLPAPPQHASSRPWDVLPNLKKINSVIFVDQDNASIIAQSETAQWKPDDIQQVLCNPDRLLFGEEGKLNYLDSFLNTTSSVLGHGNIQTVLLSYFREALLPHSQERLRNQQQKISYILGKLDADRRWVVGVKDKNSANNISDKLLQAFWQCNTHILPLPAFLDSKGSLAGAKLDRETAEKWLEKTQDSAVNDALETIKSILKGLDEKSRLPLIRSKKSWKIVSVYDAQQTKDKVVSYQELVDSKEKSLLFAFAGMNKHEKIQLLARCLSNQPALAIRSDDQNLLFEGEQLPKEDENEAILTALVKSDTALNNDIELRKELLKKCHDINKENSEATQGIRYLLHADFDKKNSTETLWVNDRKQNPVWEKLWTEMQRHKQSEWSVINRDLANIVYNQWKELAIQEVEEDSILNELERNYKNISRDAFTQKEQYEILCEIDSGTLWKSLPWHKTIDGRWVSIQENTYLKTSVELPDALKNGLNIIEPISDIAEKQKWITKLDEAAAISIALNSAEPSAYHEKILACLGKSKVTADLEKNLQSKSWLLLKNNQPISPNDIIAIDGLEDAIQKLAASADYAYASDKDLHDSITQHSDFEQKVKPLFANEPKDILEKLALLMNEASAYAIGSLDESDDIGNLAKTLADCEFAPSWGVIKAIVDKFTLDDCKHDLLDKLEGYPEKEALIKIFDWLQKKDTKQAQAAYAFYLRQMVDVGYVEELLPQIKLLAKDGKSWKLARELCIGAPSVDDSFVLCDEQRLILKSHLKFGSEPVDKETNGSTQPTQLDNYLELFEGLSKNQLLGLLLILIGKAKDKKEQIKAYLNPFHIDQIFNGLKWNPPILNSLSILNYDFKITRSFEIESKKSCESALVNGLHIKLEQQQKNSKFAETNNILGNRVTFKLKENIDNLFIDKSKLFVDKEEQKVSTILYLWDKKLISLQNSEHANEIIRKTCHWLWTELYLQDEDSLNQVFNQLSESHQLDIDVTRKVILKHIVPYLDESLNANSELPLKEYLSEAKDIEFRLAMNEKGNNQKDKEKLEKELKSNQEKLIFSLKKSNVHNYILRKLREKLSNYQYEKSGIPFELFQNADDALLEMKRYLLKEDFDNQIKQFNIKIEGNVLYLSHWGRPINYRGTSEVQKKWPHFAYDLKKMLTLSASGKSDDTGVTGRFGLGFKSVFLACDSPKIISGDLKVNIVAGFLPEVWVGNDCIEAVNILKEQTNNPRYQGTLVVLPLSNEVQPDDVLSRFQKQQAMLCLTGKMLRSIVINDIAFTWQPKHLKASKTLEFGGLDGKHYLVFRDQLEQGYVAVIFHVSARGFELLKDETPSFWVVAPTRETASVGFIISAPFQIDAGRGQLAVSDTHDDQNQFLAEQLGKRFGFALADLYKMAWKELLPQLELAEDVSKAEWWTSLWKQFEKFNWEQNVAPFHLANIFVKNLLLKWSSETGMIPNGQVAAQAEMVSCQSVRYNMPENWLKPDALEELQCWAEFTKNHSTNSIVSPWMTNLLRKIGFDSEITDLGLNNLLELISEERCTPQIAAILGKFIAIAYDTANTQLSETDKKQLHDAELKFLAKDETYQPTDKLLIASSKNKNNKEVIKKDEEKLRADFAPDKYVLSEQYGDDARGFFKLCRKQMGYAKDLETWFISAPAEKQEAALLYIVKSDGGQKLADEVRNQRTGKWFDKKSLEGIIKNWNDNDKKTIRHRLYSDDDVGDNTLTPSLPPAPPKPQASLAQIHQWWEEKGRKYYRNHYLSQLYPRGETPNLTIHENGGYSRQDWMLLLSIGVFQRLGRVRDFGTKGFIEYLQRKDWWDTFCTNPKENGEGWLNMLYQYSESQDYDEEYSYWMTMLPNLFKIALNLNSYVILFEGIQHRNQENIPDILNPNLDPLLQGAGFGRISPINRTLRKGFSLVVRELLRTGVIDTKEAHAHAYMAAPRVQRILAQLSDTGWQSYETSQAIHQLLCNSLDEEKATFGGDFDIPLLVLASNKNLLTQIAGIELDEDDEAEGLFE